MDLFQSLLKSKTLQREIGAVLSEIGKTIIVLAGFMSIFFHQEFVVFCLCLFFVGLIAYVIGGLIEISVQCLSYLVP